MKHFARLICAMDILLSDISLVQGHLRHDGGKEFGMRKMYKNKKRCCGLCKPNKRGIDCRWKAKDKDAFRRFARSVAKKKFDEV